MNHCRIQQKKSNFSSFDHHGDRVVCPKPRRLSLFDATMNEPVRPVRWLMCNQQETYESKAGPELLDLIFAKGGGYGSSEQTCTQAAAAAASSPPFFSGSPPSRVSNPLTQDARFGDDKFSPISPESVIPAPNSGVPSSSSRKQGFLRSDYGNKPAVIIEGFDCLDRDNRRNCSIPTLA